MCNKGIWKTQIVIPVEIYRLRLRDELESPKIVLDSYLHSRQCITTTIRQRTGEMDNVCEKVTLINIQLFIEPLWGSDIGG